ncbi:hypothetical protein M422DRAFT_262229 [Sphaerobolus stellatus SS14]|uniref:Uncharacterized protein n=1 Tax=Sphaerobolus stellatus (strain SS14) TaxID=990650 RepID=A0A0C9VD38_SPHS4|nr:hypothetical protein M422DRAFT_262229 [Sphaerobolus stellatus SS14]
MKLNLTSEERSIKLHYEKALENTVECRKAEPNFVGLSREAAYNLSLIYMVTGANRLAQTLYRQWLSI